MWLSRCVASCGFLNGNSPIAVSPSRKVPRSRLVIENQEFGALAVAWQAQSPVLLLVAAPPRIYVEAETAIDQDKLALVTPFDSVVNMARDMYRIFPVSLLQTDHYDAVGQINAVQAPVLALVAEDDGIVPRKRTNALINKIPADQVIVRVIEDTNHNNIQNSVAYAEALTVFFAEGAR